MFVGEVIGDVDTFVGEVICDVDMSCRKIIGDINVLVRKGHVSLHLGKVAEKSVLAYARFSTAKAWPKEYKLLRLLL